MNDVRDIVLPLVKALDSCLQAKPCRGDIRHLPGCRNAWGTLMSRTHVDPPCSRKCVAARLAIEQGHRWLDRTERG